MTLPEEVMLEPTMESWPAALRGDLYAGDAGGGEGVVKGGGVFGDGFAAGDSGREDGGGGAGGVCGR